MSLVVLVVGASNAKLLWPGATLSSEYYTVIGGHWLPFLRDLQSNLAALRSFSAKMAVLPRRAISSWQSLGFCWPCATGVITSCRPWALSTWRPASSAAGARRRPSADLGFGRIVASAIEVPIVLANLV